jgi:hypothetical protein
MKINNNLIVFLIIFIAFIIECESIKQFIKGLVLGAILSHKKGGDEHSYHHHFHPI